MTLTLEELRSLRVLVTGGTGFLGRNVVGVLQRYGVRDVIWADHVDLTRSEDTQDLFHRYNPDVVLHLAGYNGGIAFNRQHPAQIFTDNTLMALNVLREAQETDVDKVVSVVASCAYPACRTVLSEGCLNLGPPHDSVACHGYAKRNVQLASSFFHEEFGLNAVTVCPTTLYGPGDSYDATRTKVVGAMVRRFVDAHRERLPTVSCWGTGEVYREFLYVEDAADLIVTALLNYEDSSQTLNLGTGQELTIRRLAETVADVVGYKGTILWDESKPDGQFRKRLDLTRMNEVLRDAPVLITPLELGLAATVKDYQARYPVTERMSA